MTILLLVTIDWTTRPDRVRHTSIDGRLLETVGNIMTFTKQQQAGRRETTTESTIAGSDMIDRFAPKIRYPWEIGYWIYTLKQLVKPKSIGVKSIGISDDRFRNSRERHD